MKIHKDALHKGKLERIMTLAVLKEVTDFISTPVVYPKATMTNVSMKKQLEELKISLRNSQARSVVLKNELRSIVSSLAAGQSITPLIDNRNEILGAVEMCEGLMDAYGAQLDANTREADAALANTVKLTVPQRRYYRKIIRNGILAFKEHYECQKDCFQFLQGELLEMIDDEIRKMKAKNTASEQTSTL